jgi:hypothetical protein
MEQYAAEVEQLNILYADHSSEEYARGVAAIGQRLRELLDAAEKYEQQLQRINEAEQAGYLKARGAALARADSDARRRMEETVTKPQGGAASGRSSGPAPPPQQRSGPSGLIRSPRSPSRPPTVCRVR